MNPEDSKLSRLSKVEKSVSLYTATLTLLMLAALVGCFYWIEQLGPSQTELAAAGSSTVLPIHLLITLTLVSGTIGGCLFNIHSLTKHVSRGDFQERYSLSYLFTPISGAVCGFIVIVLFLGGVLTLGLGQDASDMALRHPGRLMPFVGIAVVAGYGSRQFKLKLDELAETLFRTDKNENSLDD